MIDKLQTEMLRLSDPQIAVHSTRFFKTNKGEYGEGDKFLGIPVPQIRLVAKKYGDLQLSEAQELIKSQWHEERLLALIILVNQFKKADSLKQKQIYSFYLENTKYINNWDLVDTSARDVVGGYLYTNPEDLMLLEKLSESSSLWERRIAIIATYYFLMKGEPDLTIKIASKLLNDEEDLIQKAAGWMLREMGKRCDRGLLIEFLDNNAQIMSRTTLRYAIEYFDVIDRKKYLNIKPK
jgi:3-methyladenine DNA glycosylase AlkD